MLRLFNFLGEILTKVYLRALKEVIEGIRIRIILIAQVLRWTEIDCQRIDGLQKIDNGTLNVNKPHITYVGMIICTI